MKTDKARKLLRMKEKLEDVGLEIAGLDGKLEDREKQLKKKSGSSDLIKAKSIRKKIESKLDKLKNKLNEGVEKLEETYEWG